MRRIAVAVMLCLGLAQAGAAAMAQTRAQQRDSLMSELKLLVTKLEGEDHSFQLAAGDTLSNSFVSTLETLLAVTPPGKLDLRQAYPQHTFILKDNGLRLLVLESASGGSGGDAQYVFAQCRGRDGRWHGQYMEGLRANALYSLPSKQDGRHYLVMASGKANTTRIYHEAQVLILLEGSLNKVGNVPLAKFGSLQLQCGDSEAMTYDETRCMITLNLEGCPEHCLREEEARGDQQQFDCSERQTIHLFWKGDYFIEGLK